MDDCFCYNQILKEKRLDVAIGQLVVDAYKWLLEEVYDRWYYKNSTTTTWRGLKELLRNKYAPKEEYKHVLSDKMEAKPTSQPEKAHELVVVHKQSLNPSLESSGEPKQCKSSNLSKSKEVTCYKCRKKGHFAATCPEEHELNITSLASKLSSPNSSSEVVKQALENSSSCMMHLVLSKDVDSGHTMENEDDKAEMLSNILRGTQVSFTCEFIRYWNIFSFTRSFKQPVLNVEISSIMHLIFPLSVKKGTGTLDVCDDLKGATTTWSLTMDQTEKVTRADHSVVIKEKSPDSQTPIKPRGNYLDSQKRMKANLLSLGADCTILRPIKKTTDPEIFITNRSQSRDHYEVYQDQLWLKHKEEHIGKQSNFFVRAGDVKQDLFSKQPISLLVYKEALMSLTNLTPVLPSEMMSLLQNYKDVFPANNPIGLPPIRDASQNHIWKPGFYSERSRPLPHEICISSLHMFPVEPNMDFSSFCSFQTYQWRPGELSLCTKRSHMT